MKIYIQRCLKAILSIKDFTDKNGIKFITVIIPFLSDLTKHHPLKEELDTVEKFCRENSIPTLNLFQYFYGCKAVELWINPVNGHPNKKAHRIMAEAVGDFILNNLKICIIFSR